MNLPDISDLKEQLSELESQLADPAIAQSGQKLKELHQKHSEASSLLELVEKHAQLTTELAEAASLLEGDDEEMKTLAAEDHTRLSDELSQLESGLEELLIPRDPRDGRDIILEIRAGAGGEESALFAAELFRAYTRYGEEHGWTVHMVSSSPSEQGGFKEVVAEVSGKNVFGTLKFEMGVHRVQRIPETEKQGRIHTSTVTVAVLPQAEEVDLSINPSDLRIDTYRASGAGGQHVNKTSSAIRITHEPTGVVVAVQDERSQHKNREKAMKILRARILQQQEEEQRSATAADRKAQVGTGDRSEKIRTYNYPQDRITDHRIKESWSNIPAVMEGQFEQIFNDVRSADRELKVSQET